MSPPSKGSKFVKSFLNLIGKALNIAVPFSIKIKIILKFAVGLPRYVPGNTRSIAVSNALLNPVSVFMHSLQFLSIYALTFSIRDVQRKKKLPGYSKTNCIVAVNDYVTKAAKKYGYVAELLPESGIYKKNMYTAMFSIKHKYISKNLEKVKSMFEQYDNLTTELWGKLNRVRANV